MVIQVYRDIITLILAVIIKEYLHGHCIYILYKNFLVNKYHKVQLTELMKLRLYYHIFQSK